METRDTLVATALRLFAEHGYDATSVADIQLASGLTAGSGALYKHFSSKQELLAEVVRRYISELEKSRAGLMEVLPDEPRAALRMIATAVSDAMASDRPGIRVALRDLEQFPELLTELWDGVLGALYSEMATWLTAQRSGGRIKVKDPAATAAVLLASLTYYRILDALIDRTPGDIDASTYLSAWVDSAVATLQVQGTQP
jgi:AcrR family transcriptional regulator